MLMIPNDVECTITAIDAKGRGVARTGHGLIVVPRTIPGDVVRVRITKKRKGIIEAMSLELITPSANRVTPRCPYADRCGGCPWQMVDYAAQLRMKRQIVADALAGIAIPDIPEPIPSPEIFYFRNRMDYAIGANGEIGLKSSGQWWNVLNLETCFLLSPESVELMKRVRVWLHEHRIVPWDNRFHKGFARYVVIREGKRTNERMLFLITAPGELLAMDDLVARCKDLTTSIIWGVNPTITDISVARNVRTLIGNDVIHERIGDQIFSIPPNAFFQTNTAMAEQLVATVREFAALTGTELLVDLYCGVGMFGIALAPEAHKIIGVESEPSAIPTAQQNAIANNVTNIQFQLALAEKWSFPIDPIDVLIVDPPRSGLHPRVVKKIIMLQPARIIYVSCNPAALARDLKLLLPRYSASAIRCLDLFPHTPHVETVVRLSLTEKH